VISWLRAKDKVGWEIRLMNQELGFEVVYGMYGKLEEISGRLSTS
jgi:hypothetical protein